MVKAVEGKIGLIRAIEIWKELEVKKVGAGHHRAWKEMELSRKTWIDCNSALDYENKMGHYKRLNNMVMKYFYDQSKQNNQEYPPLLRRRGKIGMMTNSLAVTEINRNIHMSATTAVKAMDINKGKDLGIGVAERLTSDLVGKAVALGFDDKETAKMFIDSQIKAIKQISMTHEERQDLSKNIVNDIMDTLNQNPQITQQDQKHQDLVGGRDSLSSNNPNVRKADDSTKPD